MRIRQYLRIGLLALGVYAMPDWLDAELLIVFAMAAAGIYTMINEGRQHRREAEERIALHARIAALEVAMGTAATSERVEVVYAMLDERLEALTEKLDLHGRMSAVEARIDHKPITHTRDKKTGRYVPPEAVASE